MPAPEFDRDAELHRRDPIPDADRTPARDEAAETIEAMWPATLVEMAEESGYSRQHIRNTLDAYFILGDEDGDASGGLTAASGRLSIDIPIPDGVDENSFARGYLAGRLDERD